MAVATRAGRPEAPKIIPRPARPLPWPLQFWRSAVGKKWIMGLTGLLLVGYVIVHALGNAKIYFGPDEINEYGEALRDLGGHLVPRTHLLWILRIGLFFAFFFHIVASFSLTRMNWKARPTKYQAARDYQVVTFAGRTMRWTSYIILVFLFVHLADLTWGWFNPDFVRGDVYANVDASLSRWWMSAFYMFATVAVALHVYHGVFSMFQSLGMSNPRIQALRRPTGAVIALFVLVLNLSFPIAVLTGIIES
jgi:succinate dehydrogenase / fumarate reductase cytochrome b subunit